VTEETKSETPTKRKPGRPKGSKTKAKAKQGGARPKPGGSTSKQGGAPAEIGGGSKKKRGSPPIQTTPEPDFSLARVCAVDGLPVTHYAVDIPERRKGGRPTTFHPAIQTGIVSLVGAGVPLRTAATAVGLPWSTAKLWIDRGRAGEEPYAGFVAAIEQSRAGFVAATVEGILRASRTDWKAAAWLLERRSPQFNPKTKVETTHKGEGVRVELYIPDNGRGR